MVPVLTQMVEYLLNINKKVLERIVSILISKCESETLIKTRCEYVSKEIKKRITKIQSKCKS